MPRDMTATGRYPPQPKYPPFNFFSCVRLGDPEMLAKIMETDPYFITQDNGAGAPIHFATTYKQLDMVHHLLNNGAEINQRDDKGFTPLHRAAYLAQYEGYLEIYEYLLSRGGDPAIRTENYDPYLNPGRHLPVDVAVEDQNVRDALRALEKKYEHVEKVREPNEDISDWWALYDYGLDTIKKWPKGYKHRYPEVVKREKEEAEKQAEKEARRARRAAAAAAAASEPASALPAATPQTPYAFLFPGQGSQAVGMLKAAKDLPKVKEMLATAEKILGYSLLDVCLEGPKTKIDDTVYSQPALYVGGLAAVEKLRAEDPSMIDKCSATAGLSLGEYTALAFAGAVSFEDGLKVVKVRAESMAAAAKEGDPHGMLSVVGLADADLEAVCKQVREKMPGRVCQIANLLFPQGRVVSGHKVALEECQKLATAKGALKAQAVAVSGAFHTPLMQSASDNLGKALDAITIRDPRIPVYSNVTAKPFNQASEIKGLLQKQLVQPVKWEDTVKKLIGSGKTKLYELGPGAQVKAMVKRIDTATWKAFTNVQP
ncbi:S-malonyltransferase [Pycnococcus provasolii]